MPFKTVLTVVGPQSRDGDLKLAIELCRREDAHLSVLALSHAAPSPAVDFSGVVSQAWVEQRQDELKELEARAAAAGEFLVASSAAATSPLNMWRLPGPTKQSDGVRATPT